MCRNSANKLREEIGDEKRMKNCYRTSCQNKGCDI